MADPICRWRNPSVKQVVEFNGLFPLDAMKRELARSFVEKRWNIIGGSSFFTTSYQLAAEMGMYYEDDVNLYPRFNSLISYEEALEYILAWGKKYYAPNPYTKSMSYDQKPVIINNFLVNWVIDHKNALWSEALKAMFKDDIGNTDILVNMINNFTEVSIKDDIISLKPDAPSVPYDFIHLDVDAKDKRVFFEFFGKIKDNTFLTSKEKFPLQQIFYGAPGTGKSHSIEDKTNGKSKIRTTFHPDSDYSTFVGCYKPFKANGSPSITYEFVPQAFVKAYVEAWKKYKEPISREVFLVIEEINRGNCAQIFGDLFQLLDRDNNGFSKYRIDADSDLQRYLQKAFDGITFEDQFADIKSGEKLCLPNNLHIWATMNTSDQSLFPMDSAFKRRWEWEYVPVNHEDAKRFHVFIGGKSYNWDDFIKAVNKKVFDATQSADKQLGNRFCKSDGLINSGESDEKKQEYMIFSNQFVSKVMFYLWEEVCKDAPEDEQINFMRLKEKITSTSSEYFTFQELYEEKKYKGEFLKKEVILQMFMNYLGVVEESSADFKSLLAGTSIADKEESVTGRKPTVCDVNEFFATKTTNDSVASSDDDGDGTSDNNEE